MKSNAIEEINESTHCGLGIARDAAEHGYTPIQLADNGLVGDNRLTLFACGESRAIATNGDPIWEDATDRHDWADLLASMGL